MNAKNTLLWLITIASYGLFFIGISLTDEMPVRACILVAMALVWMSLFGIANMEAEA